MEKDIRPELEKLKTALESEEDSSEFYTDIEEKFSNPITKKIFKFLAKQELIHINKIKEFDKELSTASTDIYVESQFNIDSVEEEAKKFFNLNVVGFKELPLEESEIEAYETALEVETAEYRLYKSALDKTTNYNLKKFFTYLMREEQILYSLIKVTLRYLKDPKRWVSIPVSPPTVL